MDANPHLLVSDSMKLFFIRPKEEEVELPSCSLLQQSKQLNIKNARNERHNVSVVTASLQISSPSAFLHRYSAIDKGRQPIVSNKYAACNKENCCQLSRISDTSANVHSSAIGNAECFRGKEVAASNQLTGDKIRWLLNATDITHGKERVKISWTNGITSEFPPSFQYISQNLVFQNARISLSLSCIREESCCPACFDNCLLGPNTCVCAGEGGFAYTSEGVLKELFLEECISLTRDSRQQNFINCGKYPLWRSKKGMYFEACRGHLKRRFIKECWRKCGCTMQCGNRVVQRGIKHKLQVFWTSSGKVWGLKTLEKLPKGTFVCEFVGEILTISEFYARDTEKCTSLALLEAYWAQKEAPMDEEVLCLDATSYGNVSRFINHRCLDANLIEIPVEVEALDRQYYHLAFFTTRDVDAQEELTWDYGVDFNDFDHPIKRFRCRCGSMFCRGINCLTCKVRSSTSERKCVMVHSKNGIFSWLLLKVMFG